MRNARLDDSQAEIKIAKRNINNLRYADDEHYCQCLLDDTLLLLKQLLKVSPLESLVLYSRPQLGTRLTELSLPLLLPSCGISGPATHGFPDGGIPHTQYQK